MAGQVAVAVDPPEQRNWTPGEGCRGCAYCISPRPVVVMLIAAGLWSAIVTPRCSCGRFGQGARWLKSAPRALFSCCAHSVFQRLQLPLRSVVRLPRRLPTVGSTLRSWRRRRCHHHGACSFTGRFVIKPVRRRLDAGDDPGLHRRACVGGPEVGGAPRLVRRAGLNASIRRAGPPPDRHGSRAAPG